MKRMKKLASLLLAMVMVLSMTVAAFAEDVATPKDQGQFEITLKNKNSGHTYTAYQVFKGDLLVTDKGSSNEKTKLSNIEWADNVMRVSDFGGKRESLIVALKKVENEKGEAIFDSLKDDNNVDADEVAKILAQQKDDSTAMQNFVKAIRPFLGFDGKESVEGKTDNKFNGTYKISDLRAGYYLVEDSLGGDQEGDAYSRYILEVVADVEADVKAVTPEITKKILEGTNKVDANTAGVGQSVSYEIMGEVPQYQSYDHYYYVINDTLSKGLTFNNDIVVELGIGTKDENGKFVSFNREKTLTVTAEGDGKPDYYVYTGNDADGKTFQIAFENIKSFAVGKAIRVTYSATVNEEAEVGNTGNKNEATLTYSNNPNESSRGDVDDKPGTPDPEKNTVTGDTPKDITITYLAQVDISKTFEGLIKNLPGAEFTITGTSKQTFLTGKTYYVELKEGEQLAEGETVYYRLKNDVNSDDEEERKEKYTTEEPEEPVIEDGVLKNEGTAAQYVRDENGNYKKFKQVTANDVTEVDTPVALTGTTDKTGKLVFKGLGEGTYKIEETKVPAGFNKAPIVTVVITAKIDGKNLNDSTLEVVDGNEKVTWGKEGSDNSVTLISVKDKDGNDIAAEYAGTYQASIENRSGSLLPSTGGIGRTIFYAAGIILMAGAMFFVVRRKRA